MLIGPYSPFTEALVQHFTSATLVATPKRLSGSPFKLYIVQPMVEQAGGASFGNELQLLDTHARPFTFNGSSWLVTQWRFLHSAQPSYQRVYWYNVAQFSNLTTTKPMTRSLCGFTAMQAGDTLLAPLEQAGKQSQSFNVKVQAFTVNPYTLTYGPIAFETYRDISSPWQPLQTSTGKDTLTVSP